jgi:hypothetical protein
MQLSAPFSQFILTFGKRIDHGHCLCPFDADLQVDVRTLRQARQGRYALVWHWPLRRFVTAAIMVNFLLLSERDFWGSCQSGAGVGRGLA